MAKKANCELKIERGIPVPESSGRRSPLTTVISALQTTESVLVPDMTSAKTWARIQNHLRSPKGKSKKFRCRTVEGGTRVWRIK